MTEQIKKPKVVRENTAVADVESGQQNRTTNLKIELDNLLDEIDEVLETNAQEFVKSYVQKGGQ
ncbi:MAG: ubiquitin-like protein Pup [Actinobacteria bacterium]|nr:MAG: ubiquitin-like protein Pup [Actinomycetota bacterium]